MRLAASCGVRHNLLAMTVLLVGLFVFVFSDFPFAVVLGENILLIRLVVLWLIVLVKVLDAELDRDRVWDGNVLD